RDVPAAGPPLPDRSSSGGESHPSALTEPDVRLSPHPALPFQPHGFTPSCHRAKSWGLPLCPLCLRGALPYPCLCALCTSVVNSPASFLCALRASVVNPSVVHFACHADSIRRG